MPKRPTYTWKYVPFTAAAPLPERKFRSQPTCYESINGERDLIREGASRVIRVTVYEWQKDTGRWMTFERIDLKAGVEAERAYQEKLAAEARKGDGK